MYKRLAYGSFVIILLLSLVLSGHVAFLADAQHQNLTPTESQILNEISGTNAYNYDLELEKIALNHSIGYSFRSSGSSGASVAAKWIEEQFVSFGLETHTESFEFMTLNETSDSLEPTTWNLTTEPTLIVYDNGNLNTTIQSFQCEQYSWPTPNSGILANLVTLPLPNASSRDSLRGKEYPAEAWYAVNTTGKILVIGREFSYLIGGGNAFISKLQAERPAAVIFTWSYDWMSWAPPIFYSFGGRPGSTSGPYFWRGKIPVGWVDYEDGLLLREKAARGNVSAWVSIQASIGPGPHINVIGKLTGSVHPEKMIIVSGHYDTVMTPAFCDNGAGISGVMELARVFSDLDRKNLYKPEYSILFIAFSGEELGSVGAVDFIKRHVNELNNIVAVINLDSIGTGTLQISETFPDDNGLDLQSLVMKAAQDVGLNVTVTAPGGSDQEAFRNPVETDDEFLLFWGVRTGLRNSTRVKSSIMLASFPLFINDIWGAGKSPGWIHTPYDNSTSTSTLGWVTIDKLESHIRVAGLTVVRVLSVLLSPLLSQIYISTAIAFMIASVLAYFERSRLRAIMARVRKNILAHIGTKELLYIVVLTLVFMFISVAMSTRLGRIEVISNDHPAGLTILYYGTPFEALGVPQPTVSGIQQGDAGLQFTSTVTGAIRVLWVGLLLDIVLLSLLALAVTYMATEIKFRREFPKS